MSTPDQPGTPPLTRRQLRELRNTASTPIITPEDAYEAAAAAAAERAASEADPATDADETVEPSSVTDAPEAEADEPAPEEPAGDAPAEPAPHPQIPAAVDLDAAPITRRQARQQAKLRTAAIEVIPGTEHDSADAVADVAEADSDTPDVDADVVETFDEPDVLAATDDDVVETDADVVETDAGDDAETPDEADAGDDATADAEQGADDASVVHVVSPGLGAQLLAGEPGDVELPASFDHLLSRGSAGSSSAPNALILSQTPDKGSLSVPILGTGELLITGSYSLPETYGSTGAAPGTQDGKDVDAALIDGELPPASSPTPISASAAISTIKSADEIIRPPAPEKGSRLMMTLAITAGALALALATVLILAVVNGVF